MKPDQERVKNLLADTVTLLCKNGLNFRKELRVQGLIGITLDNDDVFIVHINERLSSNDDVTTVQDNDKENNAESTNLGTSGEKRVAHAKSSTAESNETVMRDSIMFSPVQGSSMDQSDLAMDADAACAIVKIEKVENIPLVEPPVSYDKMVDFASFLPDFSSARYPPDLSSMQHGSLSLPGLPAAAEVPCYPKRKHNSGLALEKLQFLPKTSEGECSDSGLVNDPLAQDSIAVMSFHGGHSDGRRISASFHPKNSDIDIGSGLNDDYSRAMASSYFGVGVDCGGQASQGFDSQQVHTAVSYSFIHSGYFYSTSSNPQLLRGAPDYSIDIVTTVSELTRRSATGNCE